MEAFCIRETDEVGPDRSEAGRMESNPRPAVSSLDAGPLGLFPLEGKQERRLYLPSPCPAQGLLEPGRGSWGSCRHSELLAGPLRG